MEVKDIFLSSVKVHVVNSLLVFGVQIHKELNQFFFFVLLIFVTTEEVSDGTSDSFDETTTFFLDSLAVSINALCTLGTTKKTGSFGDGRCRMTTAATIDVPTNVDAAASDDFRIEIGVRVNISSDCDCALLRPKVHGSLVKQQLQLQLHELLLNVLRLS
tara:strand:- start:75 stop:554 length:480 start_codon:yes stop_codon:yes gene_type:complete